MKLSGSTYFKILYVMEYRNNIRYHTDVWYAAVSLKIEINQFLITVKAIYANHCSSDLLIVMAVFLTTDVCSVTYPVQIAEKKLISLC